METLGPHPTISGTTGKARFLGWLSAGGRLIKHPQTFSVHLLSEGQVYMLSNFLETVPPFQALENYSQSRSPLKSLAGPNLLLAPLLRIRRREPIGMLSTPPGFSTLHVGRCVLGLHSCAL